VAILVGLAAFACGRPSSSPTAPTNPVTQTLDRAAIVEALDYWQSVAGITYVLIEDNVQPRLFIRPGTDGLAPQGAAAGVSMVRIPTTIARGRVSWCLSQVVVPTAAPMPRHAATSIAMRSVMRWGFSITAMPG
jgi:hypothetical protein